MGTWELQAGMTRDSSKAWEPWHFPAAFPTALFFGAAFLLLSPKHHKFASLISVICWFSKKMTRTGAFGASLVFKYGGFFRRGKFVLKISI